MTIEQARGMIRDYDRIKKEYVGIRFISNRLEKVFDDTEIEISSPIFREHKITIPAGYIAQALKTYLLDMEKDLASIEATFPEKEES